MEPPNWPITDNPNPRKLRKLSFVPRALPPPPPPQPQPIVCSHADYLKSFPPGYRFSPTDDELIFYLKRKINNQSLPPSWIMEVNIYQHNPETLAEMYIQSGENAWYFFTPRNRKYPNGQRPARAAGDGYWKATGVNKKVMSNDVIVGQKRALVFYIGKPSKDLKDQGIKTNWIMHEYWLEDQSPRTKRPRSGARDMRLDDSVLCKLYYNVTNVKTQNNNDPQLALMINPVDVATPQEPSMNPENDEAISETSMNPIDATTLQQPLMTNAKVEAIFEQSSMSPGNDTALQQPPMDSKDETTSTDFIYDICFKDLDSINTGVMNQDLLQHFADSLLESSFEFTTPADWSFTDQNHWSFNGV